MRQYEIARATPDNSRQTFLRSALSTRLADNAHKCRNGGGEKKGSRFSSMTFSRSRDGLSRRCRSNGRRGKGDFRDALVEYFKVDPVECFCVPAWQTAGFTTVSSIESLHEGCGGGRKRDNRDGSVGLCSCRCRAVLRAMTGTLRNRLRMKVFCESVQSVELARAHARVLTPSSVAAFEKHEKRKWACMEFIASKKKLICGIKIRGELLNAYRSPKSYISHQYSLFLFNINNI